MSSSSPILVAVVGVGLVGAEFVDQLLAQPAGIFQLVSLSSSKKTIFSAQGLSVGLSDWRTSFKQADGATVLSALLHELSELVKAGKKVVLVDNTSDENVAHLYPNFLENGVSVVTPNKKAFSGELELFEQILKASTESGAKYLNESTVGAGLPIISTLKDLVITGDQVSVLPSSIIRGKQ